MLALKTYASDEFDLYLSHKVRLVKVNADYAEIVNAGNKVFSPKDKHGHYQRLQQLFWDTKSIYLRYGIHDNQSNYYILSKRTNHSSKLLSEQQFYQQLSRLNIQINWMDADTAYKHALQLDLNRAMYYRELALILVITLFIGLVVYTLLIIPIQIVQQATSRRSLAQNTVKPWKVGVRYFTLLIMVVLFFRAFMCNFYL